MIPIGGDGDPLAAFPAVTLTEAVITARAADPGRAAVVDAVSGRTLTHAALAAEVAAAAAALAAAGVRPGTAVGVHLPDGPEFAVVLHAVAAAGAVPLPLRVTAPQDELARLLRAGGAEALITWPALRKVAQEAAAAAGVPRPLSAPDLVAIPSHPAPARDLPHPGPAGGGGARGGGRPVAGAVDLAAVAVLACSRGTAGPARVVPLSHAEMVAGLVRAADSGMIGRADTVLSALPFSGLLGLNGALNPALRLGATVVAAPGGGRHDLLRALQDRAVTVALLPPRLIETLAYDRVVPRYALDALRSVVAAGGPLRAETARACAARLGCTVRQAYGLTEAAGLTHINLRGAEEGTLDSVGRGLPGVAWRVVDAATGREQASYQPGELCVRLPATGTARPGPVRWSATGDAAFRDDHGRAYILGRLGEGRPEPPAEPETVLAVHPAVRDAVVAPAPDPELGLVPYAFVVLSEPAAAGDILEYVNDHVPPYKGVVAVRVVDEIPRTEAGAVRRRALLARAGLPG
ncbi:class I adenylate-forming enzyme family protein [Actinomadura sp. 21ATH]|uniref:class I adenylate-forming enzyme family protein n=1 Tax=Actinomadura sp. 21ATH TaxID=1735444 RepID=UPI0035C222D5